MPSLGEPPLAMLSIKRFVRGTLRQCGIGLLSLIVILSVGGHVLLEVPEADSIDSFKASRLSVVRASLPTSALSDSAHQPAGLEFSTADPLPGAKEPVRMLLPKMTHHRLTGARLSVPATRPEHTVASLSED
ncbi:MAG: hypothetical protein WA885_13355 [Phormidesmis sp.]